MPKCPSCGEESDTVLKEWDYRFFHVKRIKCIQCSRAFQAYYKQGKFSHVIDNHKSSPEMLIISYLRQHDGATTEQISNDLKLSEKIILGVLQTLEKDGDIERLDTSITS